MIIFTIIIIFNPTLLKKIFFLRKTFVSRKLSSLPSWKAFSRMECIQEWGINGRVSPRIFYKLMSMRPAISGYTGSTGYNETRVRLAIGNSQGKDTRGQRGKDRPAEKMLLAVHGFPPTL